LENGTTIQPPIEALDETTAPAHKRKKRSKSNKELPRRIVIVPVEEKDKQCACGQEKSVILYEVTEKLDYCPAILEIVEQRREVVACKNDREKSYQRCQSQNLY
jgi:transposase